MRLSNPLTKGIVRLGPRDAAFIYNESDSHLANGIVVWVFDSPDPADDFTKDQAVEWITRRLGCDRMYTQRLRRAPLSLDNPYWSPVGHFDVSDHVTVTKVLEPGWAGLAAHLDPILTARVDLDRPPWEMHVFNGIEGLDGFPRRMTGVTMKMHHSAVDGLGAVMLARKQFSETPPADYSRPVAGGAGPLVRARLLLNSVLGAPLGIVRFAKVLADGRAAAREVAAAKDAGLWSGYPESRRPNRFNMNPSGAATLQAMVFDGDELRQVADAVPGTTMNDVYLTMIGGAMARYLEGVGEASADSLVAMAPRSARQLEKWESANQVVVMSVDMHTGVADPLKRLMLISESATGEKARTSHIATRRLVALEDSAPPLVRRLISEARKPIAMDPNRLGVWQNMVSNVPMSVKGMSFNGAPCVGMLGTQPPVDKDCVRHFLTASTGDKLLLTVTVDRAAIPDQSHYMRLIRESLDELKKAAGA